MVIEGQRSKEETGKLVTGMSVVGRHRRGPFSLLEMRSLCSCSGALKLNLWCWYHQWYLRWCPWYLWYSSRPALIPGMLHNKQPKEVSHTFLTVRLINYEMYF